MSSGLKTSNLSNWCLYLEFLQASRIESKIRYSKFIVFRFLYSHHCANVFAASWSLEVEISAESFFSSSSSSPPLLLLPLLCSPSTIQLSPDLLLCPSLSQRSATWTSKTDWLWFHKTKDFFSSNYDFICRRRRPAAKQLGSETTNWKGQVRRSVPLLYYRM